MLLVETFSGKMFNISNKN